MLHFGAGRGPRRGANTLLLLLLLLSSSLLCLLLDYDIIFLVRSWPRGGLLMGGIRSYVLVGISSEAKA